MTNPIKLPKAKLQEIYTILREAAKQGIEDQQQFKENGIDPVLTQQDMINYKLSPNFRNHPIFNLDFKIAKAIYDKSIQLDKEDKSFDGKIESKIESEIEIKIAENGWNHIVGPYRSSIFVTKVETAEGEYEGTSWIIDKEKIGNKYRYWLITNAHVADYTSKEEIRYIFETQKDGNAVEIEAKLGGVDHIYDVGVLYFESEEEYVVLPVDRDAKVNTSDEINIVGNQDTGGITDNIGEVNSTTKYRNYIRTIQDNTETYGGNSGSPVFNKDGMVVAICVSGEPGYNFNIPIEYVIDSYKKIRKSGTAAHGIIQYNSEHWGRKELSTIVSTVKDKEIKRKLEEYSYAFFVTNVLMDRSAGKAGLRSGDIILEYDDNPVYSNKESGKLGEYIARKKEGDKLKYLVFRNGEFITLNIPVEIQIKGISPTYNIPATGLVVLEINESQKIDMGYGNVPGKLLLYELLPYESTGDGSQPDYSPQGILFKINDTKAENIQDVKTFIKKSTNDEYVVFYYLIPNSAFKNPSIGTKTKRNPFFKKK